MFPMFDGNFNLNFLDMHIEQILQDGNAALKKGTRATIDMKKYRYSYGETQLPAYLLDELRLYATSADDFFDTIINCASVGGMRCTLDELQQWGESKSNFVNRLQERMSTFHNSQDSTSKAYSFEIEGKSYYFSSPLNCSCLINLQEYSMQDFLHSFNMASVALFSLPALLALTYLGEVTLDESENSLIGRGVYNYKNECPSDGICYQFMLDNFPVTLEIENFDEYLESFVKSAWVICDLDLFLTVFGLAHAIAYFVQDTRIIAQTARMSSSNPEETTMSFSFRDFVNYEPLLDLLDWLTAKNALPKLDSKVWTEHPDGISNAEDVGGDLYSLLKLSSALNPFPPELFSSTQSILYALIDLFSLRSYFGIDPSMDFDFVAGNDGR